nr:MAG TPA: hypothetical protein [Caudoviricetes sp.]DAW36655.1 MAG TPA: hypothetical protein [Caudoviricetes sp.]
MRTGIPASVWLSEPPEILETALLIISNESE